MKEKVKVKAKVIMKVEVKTGKIPSPIGEDNEKEGKTEQ